MAAGDLDKTFGMNGARIHSPAPYTWAAGVAVQPDGRIVVAGTGQPSRAGDGQMGALRLRRDGTLDPTFGQSGVAMYNDQVPGRAAQSAAVVLQPDGAVVIAGTISGKCAVVRFLANGRIDGGFGQNGATVIGADTERFLVSSVVLQPDGRIVVGCSHRTTTETRRDFAAVRLGANGALDPGFGQNGFVAVGLGGDDWARTIVVQPDGRILLAGSSLQTGGQERDFGLVRLLPNGAPDPSFGTNGAVVIGLGGDDICTSVAVYPDGHILAAGHSRPVGSDAAYVAGVRLVPNGALDPTFRRDGVLDHDLPADVWVSSVHLTPRHILLAGSGRVSVKDDWDFVVYRFLADGTGDTGFGEIGRRALGLGGYDWGAASALQPDDRLTLVGWQIPRDAAGKIDATADRSLAAARVLL